MNTFALATIFAALAAANAGLIAVPSTRIIQGPSTRTTIAGPDGSVISAVAPGGSIVTQDHAALVAHTAPVVAATPVVAAPSIYAAPVVAAHAAYAAPLLARAAYAAPAFGYASHSAVNTVVAGPSGTVATSRTVNTPSVFAHAAPVYAHGLYY